MTRDNGAEAPQWQDLPTVVELTEEGQRKALSAQRMAEMLDDIVEPEATAQTGQGGWSVERMMRDFRFGGDEMPIIVRSAAPLLNLAHGLRQTDAQPDIEELRGISFDAVRRYERDLAAARISPERARAAHYVVCATVDDVILSKAWGVRAGWARSGLVSTFHMDVTGGDRVFDLLDHFHQNPGASKDLLLLIYLCLSLAFEGRTRVSPRGPLELEHIRGGLYRSLMGQYGDFERELSPHWRGVSARHTPLKTATGLWTLLAGLMLALALGYMFFTLSLNRVSDGTFQQLAGLPPRDTPSIRFTERAESAQPPPVVYTPPERKQIVQSTELQNLIGFLQPEVDRKLVTLSDADGRLRIRISNSGLFATGSAEVSDEFRGLLERIGGALASEKFRAVVVGYTDNVPIRTVQFPSNWHLSEARAKSVGEILTAYTGSEAILTEGRADSDPLATNDTSEGRETNRRTEILVLTNPTEQLEAHGIFADPPRLDASGPAAGNGGNAP
ncbi:type VI secretion system protein TssL, long form [Limoniibacter endophyticus]|uniref:Cell envelope biogenesis protein OmpA n=1 Tax=Limoniibacter endophyticus TaxID=1565040 RepID=A0A8J3DH13_9HYPH|nr:type VI secretion system protein TssL, long form [Limoniibacter endophyticus]GHC69543.1 cell envelope biogenesis protein OmpA [Limoniibacter endophyticus]